MSINIPTKAISLAKFVSLFANPAGKKPTGKTFTVNPKVKPSVEPMEDILANSASVRDGKYKPVKLITQDTILDGSLAVREGKSGGASLSLMISRAFKATKGGIVAAGSKVGAAFVAAKNSVVNAFKSLVKYEEKQNKKLLAELPGDLATQLDDSIMVGTPSDAFFTVYQSNKAAYADLKDAVGEEKYKQFKKQAD